MDNIYDIAHELARQLKNSIEFKEYQALTEEVYKKDENKCGGWGGVPGGGWGGPAGRSDRSGPRAETAATAASRAQPTRAQTSFGAQRASMSLTSCCSFCSSRCTCAGCPPPGSAPSRPRSCRPSRCRPRRSPR